MDNRSPYKTAAELGIEQWEHDGLVALVGPLSRGELAFYMGHVCGTAVCIGGWLNIRKPYRILIYNVGRRAGLHEGLGRLFYPHWVKWGYFYGNEAIQTRNGVRGARAIVNFLMTGDPSWDRVMSEPV